MKIGIVIGNVWSTKKEQKLSGLKLLIVQPINIVDGSTNSSPIIVADIIGAGRGEIVIIAGGSSARKAAGDSEIPVDATVVGIVDGSDIDSSLINEKQEENICSKN
ncbi:ethanolamine utilization protein EutN [Lachnotalea glycerini]|jgi:ethanolamine utilization protein EutN|uniref:Ethanolamine utilization protein EutN n=1 Tax=Lachnotalea glycerini TaxID=1763509 RepID=A0A255I3W5_9FIRM|nr:EutN/CcmL family microcompartment protein [Lachnotalea glycerini]PXV93614.1 ethanolamine utilization protein EutN [Lachnotalea glycerini]RDY32570.1 ethanolamine utilization protein EutN [Lachnotalea glycerini]